MLNTNVENLMAPEAYYSSSWLVITIILCLTIFATIAAVLFATRKRKIKTAKDLKILKPKVVNTNAIKARYLKMLNEIEGKYRANELTPTKCHQELSLLVRLYYCEAMGFHAEVMTLTDLKKTNYHRLTKLIHDYYPDEFNTLDQGDAYLAIRSARTLLEEQ